MSDGSSDESVQSSDCTRWNMPRMCFRRHVLFAFHRVLRVTEIVAETVWCHKIRRQDVPRPVKERNADRTQSSRQRKKQKGPSSRYSMLEGRHSSPFFRNPANPFLENRAMGFLQEKRPCRLMQGMEDRLKSGLTALVQEYAECSRRLPAQINAFRHLSSC